MTEPRDPSDPGHEPDEPEPDESQEPALDDPAGLGLGERDPDGLDVTAAELEALGLDPDALEDDDTDDAGGARTAGTVAGTPPAGAGPTAVGALDDLLDRPSERYDPERLRTLLELLGRPDQAQPAVVVCASHGASSLARMIAALLGALGLTAGTYETAHLQDPAERCRVAAELPDRPSLEASAAELAAYLAEADSRFPDPVSRDEALAALAFSRFADAPVDLAVVEAGDAGERGPAGFVRAEVVVVGPLEDDDATTAAALARDAPVVVETPAGGPAGATERDTPGDVGTRWVVVGRDAELAGRDLAVAGQHLSLQGVTGEVDDVYLALQGRHQADHAVAALAAVEGLLGFAGGLDPEVVREGFAAVRAPARLEVVRRPDAATVVLDLADRPARARALSRALDEEFAFDRRLLVAAPAASADVAATLQPLVGPGGHVVATPAAGAADPERVVAAAEALGARAETADDPAHALEAASRSAGATDAIVVAGVAALAGAIRAALGLAPA